MYVSIYLTNRIKPYFFFCLLLFLLSICVPPVPREGLIPSMLWWLFIHICVNEVVWSSCLRGNHWSGLCTMPCCSVSSAPSLCWNKISWAALSSSPAELRWSSRGTSLPGEVCACPAEPCLTSKFFFLLPWSKLASTLFLSSLRKKKKEERKDNS